jgi:hypothetical protein
MEDIGICCHPEWARLSNSRHEPLSFKPLPFFSPVKKKPISKTKSLRDYDVVLSSVVELLDAARRTSARAVNSIMTATYWEVGRRIVEFEQGGEKRAEYGEELLKRLSQDLTTRFGRGFSRQNLQNMRQFYLASSLDQIRQTASGKSSESEKRATSSLKSRPSSLFLFSGCTQSPGNYGLLLLAEWHRLLQGLFKKLMTLVKILSHDTSCHGLVCMGIRTRQESWLISLPEELQSEELLQAIISGEVNSLSGSCEIFEPSSESSKSRNESASSVLEYE